MSFALAMIWLLGLLALDPVILELAPERGAADAERLGGAGVVAAEALERLEDVGALGVGEADLPRQGRRGPEQDASRHVRRQIVGLDRVAAGEDRGALDRVLQLAHVARPRIAQEALERLR